MAYTLKSFVGCTKLRLSLSGIRYFSVSPDGELPGTPISPSLHKERETPSVSSRGMEGDGGGF